MYEFFIQFTFMTDFGSSYWLPHIVEAASVSEAKDLAQRFLTGLTATYRNVQSTEPCLLLEGLNADPIRTYIEHQLKGRVHAIETRMWRIKDSANAPDLSFDEQIRLMPRPAGEKVKIATVSIHELPIRKVTQGTVPLDEEYLVVDVVRP
jgi:hypothetical protein